MPTEEQLRATIPECVGWLAGVEPIGGALLEQADSLKVISRNGVGVSNIEMPVADRLGITVARAEGANARGVAELAFALMLSGFRHIPWSDAGIRSGQWQRRKGFEAQGRTLGLIGCGAIGRLVATMATQFGMKVIGFDPFPDDSFVLEGFRYGEIGEVLEHSHAISLHCPPSDKPLLDKVALAEVREGVVIINTARAELVDETALLGALNRNQIGCYATDVYACEPPAPGPLITHDRVILMPHAGGFTEESVDRATQGAVSNLLSVLERR